MPAQAQDVVLDLQEDWKFQYVPRLTDGVSTLIRDDDLAGTNLIECENLYYYQHELRSDTGYATFGQTLRGEPRRSYQFLKQSGSVELLLVTNDTFYLKVDDEWHYVSDGTSTSCTDGEPAGETSIVVGDITGFSDGDFVGIILDDGTQHQTTINGVPAGVTIVITDAVPVGLTISAAAEFVKAVDLTGDPSKQISIVTDPSQDDVIFTNGIDAVQVYDGSTCEALGGLSGISVSTCAALIIFQSSLLLFGTVETGSSFTQRIRWSDTADFIDWTTGNASYLDLFDNEDPITSGVLLGPYCIVYRTRSIVRGEYIGSTERLYNFETVISDEGCQSHDGVVDMQDHHIFFGNDGVYEYRGGANITPISEDIYSVLFGTLGEVHPSYISRIFGFRVPELKEVWFFYTVSGGTYPTKTARYRIDTGAWTFRTWQEGISGFGTYFNIEGLRWIDAEGTWAEQDWYWTSSKLLAQAPVILLGLAETLETVTYDHLAVTDDGTDIVWHAVTKAFSHPRFKFRVDDFQFRAKGTAVLIEYLIDDGSWTTYENVTLNATATDHQITNQFVTKRVQWRISGTGAGFSMDWIGFSYEFESEW